MNQDKSTDKMNFGSFDMSSIPMQQIPSLDLHSNERVTHNTAATEQPAMDNSVAKKKPHVPKCIDKTKTLLPLDFQPSNYSIICGNKRKFFNSPGNSRLRVLVQSFIPQFSQADGKLEKGMIVSKVMSIVKEACPVGAFVTFEKGRWWQVSDRTSREKVGSLFRDFLSDKYKSSAQNKIARRKTKRAEKKQRKMSMASSSAASSVAASSVATSSAAVMPTPENVASLPPLEPQSETQQGQHDEDSSISSASCSFYDVDDLSPVQLEEL